MSMDHNSSLVSNDPSENDERDDYLARWEIAILSIILLVTLIGNSLVLLTLYLRHRRVRGKKFTRMYFFIMHLSIADLLNGLFNVLPQLIWDITFRFQGGLVLCKLVKYGQPLGPYLSSFVLTATALDRFQAICHPITYCGTMSRRSRIMVYCAWCLALTFCVPQIIVFSYREVTPGVWDCWATFDLIPYGERIYVTWYSVSVFLLPLCVLIYTYARICTNIGKYSGTTGRIDVSFDRVTKNCDFLNWNRSSLISRARINTVKQSIVIVSLYVACSSPFIGSLLWATWDPKAASSPFFSGAAFTILTLLNSLNSCANPWIYLAFNRNLRQALLDGPRDFAGRRDTASTRRTLIMKYLATFRLRRHPWYRDNSIRRKDHASWIFR